MREIIAAFACVLGFVAVGGAALVWIISFGIHASCSATAGKMGVESSYSLLTDCMVKVDGRWEPLRWQRSTRIKD